MKLIDFPSTGKQIRTIPKSDIPSLIGEIEMVKASLWLRLTEWEEPEPAMPFSKKVRDPAASIKNSAQSILPIQAPGPQGRILKLKDIVQMVGLSRSTIWKKVSEGTFPKCRKISERSVGWLDTEIHNWIHQRFGESR